MGLLLVPYPWCMIEILIPEELAELLRLSQNRVILLARQGEIPSLNIDGRLRFDASEIEEWIRAQRGDVLLRKPPRLVTEEADADPKTPAPKVGGVKIDG